jgi:hypothetical protein
MGGTNTSILSIVVGQGLDNKLTSGVYLCPDRPDRNGLKLFGDSSHFRDVEETDDRCIRKQARNEWAWELDMRRGLARA